MRFVFSILFLFSVAVSAQQAYITLDTHRLRIGEQTVMRIFFEYANPREDALIGWPQFDDEISDNISVIDKTVDYESLIDSVNFVYRREQQITISAFRPDTFIIAPIEIEFNENVFRTNAETLMVETVEVDTSKGIVDVHPIYEVEYSFTEMAADWFKMYWYVFAGIAFVAALFLLFRLLKNRKKEEVVPEPPKIPAHVTALEKLNSLLIQENWKTENKKAYYSDLTDTVRKYLEERFDIYALEKTTREIITDLKNADISDDDKLFLKKILSQADMVKFAKFKPADEDGFVLLKHSIEFVVRTKKLEEESNVE